MHASGGERPDIRLPSRRRGRAAVNPEHNIDSAVIVQRGVVLEREAGAAHAPAEDGWQPEAVASAQRLQARSDDRAAAKQRDLESFRERVRRRVEERARLEREDEAKRKEVLRVKVSAMLETSERRIKAARMRAVPPRGKGTLREEAARAADEVASARAFLAQFVGAAAHAGEGSPRRPGPSRLASSSRPRRSRDGDDGNSTNDDGEDVDDDEDDVDEDEDEDQEEDGGFGGGGGGGGSGARNAGGRSARSPSSQGGRVAPQGADSLPSWDRGLRPEQRMTRDEERRLARALKRFEMFHARKAVSLSRTGAAWAPPAAPAQAKHRS